MLTALNMRVNGRMINNMALGLNIGLTVVSTKETMSTQRNKATADISGPMATSILENGMTTLLMEKESMFGLMAEFTLVTGKEI